MHEDQIYIEALLNDNSALIEETYLKARKVIIPMILNNSGSHEQGEELIQNSIIVLYERIKKEAKFELTCKVETFLYSIARNLWLKELQKNKRNISLTEKEEMVLKIKSYLEISFEEEDSKAKRSVLFWEKFHLLGENCQTILKKYFEEIDLKEIATQINQTYKSIRVTKHRCIQKLLNLIQKDSRFNELKN